MFWPLRDKLLEKKSIDNRLSVKREREVLQFRDHEVHVKRRPYRRSIGLTLQVNGRIRVSAPKSTPITRIEEFLRANTDWIESNLRKYQSLRDAFPPKQYLEGEAFPFLGSELKLKFMSGSRSKLRFVASDGELIVEVPPTEWMAFDPSKSHPEIAKALSDFFAREARRVIGERLKYYSAKMELWPSAVRYRSQKTRWGSCSAKGVVSLNWRLVVAPLEVIDYVVVHELAHLRFYNHSANFWSLVETQVPRYSELRRWLRVHQYTADFLAKKSELHPLVSSTDASID